MNKNVKRSGFGGFVWGLIHKFELSTYEAARALKVTRPHLSRILNNRMGISPEMAVRLSIVFGINAENLLISQVRAQLKKVNKKKIKLKPMKR